jgi:chromate transporter
MSFTDDPRPGLRELVRTFGQIGLLNFGGPAGQIALMHRVLVEQKRWIADDAYLRALNFCTLLPGPEAQQLATYVGWKLRGVPGGLIAGLLFILPGTVVILALATLYALAARLGPVSAAFLGIKAAVLAIVLEALLRLGRRALQGPLKPAIAAAAFLALFVFQAPFPAVVIAAGALGYAVARVRPELLRLKLAAAPTAPPGGPLLGPALRTVVTWVAIWMAPLALLLVLLGPDHRLVQIGAFFAKLAVVTVGGAYAVLSYMAQVVVGRGWLGPGEMVDGLGLAETTPGPLILVTEFVGFVAAYKAPAPFPPLLAGLFGAGLTVWMTFAPCFLWIFAGGPFIERLERARSVQGALAAITAAVVGVIANLTVWFGLHVLFGRFAVWRAAGVQVSTPDPLSLDWRALGVSLVAGLLLFKLHAGVLRTLAAAVLLGMGLHLAGLA